jgi:hypothetical protein
MSRPTPVFGCVVSLELFDEPAGFSGGKASYREAGFCVFRLSWTGTIFDEPAKCVSDRKWCSWPCRASPNTAQRLSRSEPVLERTLVQARGRITCARNDPTGGWFSPERSLQLIDADRFSRWRRPCASERGKSYRRRALQLQQEGAAQPGRRLSESDSPFRGRAKWMPPWPIGCQARPVDRADRAGTAGAVGQQARLASGSGGGKGNAGRPYA